MSKLRSKIPPIYHGFFPEFIEKDIPDEKWATCSNCNLCQSPKSPYINAKCCNYYPHLANYLVGGILQDERPVLTEGKTRIKALIKNRQGISPYGILPPKPYTEARETHLIKKRDGIISKDEIDHLLCPYLDKGDCTIWEYRENLCSTHFCISTAGNAGREFWKSTNRYLKMTENVLSNYALMELGFPVSSLRTEPIKKIDFGIESIDGTINDISYKRHWQGWEGEEESLYIQCYEVITALNNDKFEAICGYNQVILAQAIDEMAEKFRENIIPEFLLLSPETSVKKISSFEVQLTLVTNNATVSPIVYSYLQKFDGRHTTKTVIDLAFRVILNLEKTIDELYKKGILVAANSLNRTQ